MLWLLRHLIGPQLAENILGDLEEQARVRFPNTRLRRTIWIAREIAGVITSAVALRSRETLGPRPRRHRTGFSHDGRYAIRSILGTPWYAATVIGVLTLGIALATTVFAVVDGVLLKALPYPRVEEIVSLRPGWKARPEFAGRLNASSSEVIAWMAAVPDVTFGFVEYGGLEGEQIGDGEPVRSAEVSSGFFDVIGQRPLIGGFRPEHFAGVRAIRPALLTYGTWQRRFALDPTVVGLVIHGDRGRAIEIVGVLPPEFLFPSDQGRWVPELLTPLVFGPKAASDRSRGLETIARLPSSMSIAALEARLDMAAGQLAAHYPPKPGQGGPGPVDVVDAIPIDEALRAETRVTFGLILSLAIGLVLVACLNVTGLAAARAQDRRPELTLRRVLGAGGRDLLRLLAAESGVLVGISSLAGLGLAWYLVRALGVLLPEDLVLLKALAIDWRVGLFMVLLSGSIVILTTVWPARVVLSSDASSSLLNGGRSTGRRGAVSRFVIVGTQVALALVMAVAGSLLANELVRVWRQDTGYRPGQTLNLWLTDRAKPSRDDMDAVLADLRRMPGVKAAGGYNIWLLQRAMLGARGFEKPVDAAGDGGESIGITTGFFEAAGLQPIAGRLPTDAELSGGAHVVTVSERIAREYWPGRSAIGQVVRRRGEPYSVVSVVPDARYLSLEMDPFGVIYYPLAADSQPVLVSVFIAYEGHAPQDVSSIVSLINKGHPAYRVRSVQSVTATLANSIRERTFQTVLFVAFALSAILIVSVGVLGLVAIVTGRRTREVGVRLALGAKPAGIVRLVLRQELAAVGYGLLVGGILAAWLMRLVAAYMHKASVYDPVAWATAFIVLLAAATIGVLIPAFRASRANPIDALRVE